MSDRFSVFWSAGAATGAVVGLAMVYAYASGHLAWGWLLLTSPLVILGAIGGGLVWRWRDRRLTP